MVHMLCAISSGHNHEPDALIGPSTFPLLILVHNQVPLPVHDKAPLPIHIAETLGN